MNAVVNMLRAFGFDFDPEEVIRLVQQMAADVAEMRASQHRTESMVRDLWSKEHGPKPRTSSDAALDNFLRSKQHDGNRGLGIAQSTTRAATSPSSDAASTK